MTEDNETIQKRNTRSTKKESNGYEIPPSRGPLPCCSSSSCAFTYLVEDSQMQSKDSHRHNYSHCHKLSCSHKHSLCHKLSYCYKHRHSHSHKVRHSYSYKERHGHKQMQ